MSSKKNNRGRTIVLAGLLVGTLDITAALTNAYVQNGTTPARVFQYIASAILGPEAFSGGTAIIFFGIVIHYLIAFTWTTVFFLVYPKVGFFKTNVLVTAVSYGLFIWVMMNFIALPLTAIGRSAFNPAQAAIGASILILMIGLPLAIIAKRYYGAR